VGNIPDDSNILNKVKTYISNMKNAVNMEEKIQNIKEKVSYYIEYIIDLIVIFILQTIVLPLVILWALIILLRSFLGGNLVETIKITSKI